MMKKTPTGIPEPVRVELQVLVDPSVQGLVENAVCYETGLTRVQVADPCLYAYDHHGEGFSTTDPGALTSFFEDVIAGRPLPSKFVTQSLKGFDTLFAIALFLHRDLATHPKLPGTIASVDLAHRKGPQGLAHIDPELAVFLVSLNRVFTDSILTDVEKAEQLKPSLAWIYEYFTEGNLPSLSTFRPPQIATVGTGGFVVAIAEEGLPISWAWVDLYRQGFLRGVVYQQGRFLASRKSVFVDFNLTKAASLLSELDESPWVAEELWLSSPPKSKLDLDKVLEILLRV